jgi:hypothetical protein
MRDVLQKFDPKVEAFLAKTSTVLLKRDNEHPGVIVFRLPLKSFSQILQEFTISLLHTHLPLSCMLLHEHHDVLFRSTIQSSASSNAIHLLQRPK